MIDSIHESPNASLIYEAVIKMSKLYNSKRTEDEMLCPSKNPSTNFEKDPIGEIILSQTTLKSSSTKIGIIFVIGFFFSLVQGLILVGVYLLLNKMSSNRINVRSYSSVFNTTLSALLFLVSNLVTIRWTSALSDYTGRRCVLVVSCILFIIFGTYN